VVGFGIFITSSMILGKSDSSAIMKHLIDHVPSQDESKKMAEMKKMLAKNKDDSLEDIISVNELYISAIGIAVGNIEDV